MLRRLTYLLMVLVLELPCGAQNRITRQQVDSVANPPLDRNEALRFDREMLEIGTLGEDDAPQTYRFAFANTGREPLVITKVLASCGCTVPTFSREPVAPGHRAEVAVRFTPKGHPGTLNRHVYVYTNRSSAHPAVRLTLRGIVTPTGDRWQGYRTAMGPSLRAKRERVVFRQMTRSEVRTERIECVNTGTRPLRPTADGGTLPEYIAFRTEPEVIQPGATADLVVTVDARKMPGQEPDVLRRSSRLQICGVDTVLHSLTVETEFVN